MKKKIAIFFDTSALKALGWNAAPLMSVLELSQSGLAEVYFPELVVSERRSHWIESPQRAIDSAVDALKALAANPIIASEDGVQVEKARLALAELDIRRMAGTAVANFIREHRIKELPLTIEQSKAAWESYFDGTAPHQKLKSRDDIPDAHIFQSAVDLVSQVGEVHFVCADKRLGEALRSVKGAHVHENLEALFKSGALSEATHRTQRDRTWRGIKHLVLASAIADEVKALLEEDLEELVRGVEFEDGVLPGHATRARVDWALGAELVRIENPDDWGGGRMSFQFECETVSGISATMSIEDARDIPEWMRVSAAHGGLLDIEASVKLAVQGTVDVEVNLLNAERGVKPLLGSATLETSTVRLFIIRE